MNSLVIETWLDSIQTTPTRFEIVCFETENPTEEASNQQINPTERDASTHYIYAAETRDMAVDNPKNSLEDLAEKFTESGYFKQKENIDKVDLLIEQAEQSLKALKKEFYQNAEFAAASNNSIASSHKIETDRETRNEPEKTIEPERGTPEPDDNLEEPYKEEYKEKETVDIHSENITCSDRCVSLTPPPSIATQNTLDENQFLTHGRSLTLSSGSLDISKEETYQECKSTSIIFEREALSSKTSSKSLSSKGSISNEHRAEKSTISVGSTKIQVKKNISQENQTSKYICSEILVSNKKTKLPKASRSDCPVCCPDLAPFDKIAPKEKSFFCNVGPISKSSDKDLVDISQETREHKSGSRIQFKESVHAMEAVKSTYDDESEESDCSCPFDEVLIKQPTVEQMEDEITAALQWKSKCPEGISFLENSCDSCVDDGHLNTISERTEIDDTEFKSSKKEKLVIQHMPQISIRPPLRIQKVFQINIKPTDEIVEDIVPSQNIYYQEIRHRETDRISESAPMLLTKMKNGSKIDEKKSDLSEIPGIKYSKEDEPRKQFKKPPEDDIAGEDKVLKLKIPEKSSDWSMKGLDSLDLSNNPSDSFELSKKLSESLGMSRKTSESSGSSRKPSELLGASRKPSGSLGVSRKASASLISSRIAPESVQLEASMVVTQLEEQLHATLQISNDNETCENVSKRERSLKRSLSREEVKKKETTNKDVTFLSETARGTLEIERLSLDDVTYLNDSFHQTSLSEHQDITLINQAMETDDHSGDHISAATQTYSYENATDVAKVHMCVDTKVDKSSGTGGTDKKTGTETQIIEVGTQVQPYLDVCHLEGGMSIDESSESISILTRDVTTQANLPDCNDLPPINEEIFPVSEINSREEEAPQPTKNQITSTQGLQDNQVPSSKRSIDTQTHSACIYCQNKAVQNTEDQESLSHIRLYKTEVCADYESTSTDSENLKQSKSRNMPFGDVLEPLPNHLQVHTNGRYADEANDFYHRVTSEESTTSSIHNRKYLPQYPKPSITSSSNSEEYRSMDETMSEGEVKCKCSVSIGELHLCRYANEIKARTNYLKKHSERMGKYELRDPNVQILRNNSYFDKWIPYGTSSSSTSKGSQDGNEKLSNT